MELTAEQQVARDGLTDRQKGVLASIEKHGIDKVADIAKELGISTNGVHGHIRRMREKGALPPGERQANANGAASKGATKKAGGTKPAAAAKTTPAEAPTAEGELTSDGVSQSINGDTVAFISSLEGQQRAIAAEIDRRSANITTRNELNEADTAEIDGLRTQDEVIQGRLDAVRGA